MNFKPSNEEEKWAMQQEIDIRKKLREFVSRQKLEDIVGEESLCPADGKSLERIEIDNTGIFVFKCTYCGGIWLNRSDMERLISSSEKSNKLVKYLSKIFNIRI